MACPVAASVNYDDSSTACMCKLYGAEQCYFNLVCGKHLHGVVKYVNALWKSNIDVPTFRIDFNVKF